MEQYTVTGMSCAACSARVEKAVSKVEGVSACSVSLLTNSMGVEGTSSAQDIIKAVEDAGYGATKKGAGKEAALSASENEELLKDRDTPLLKQRLYASLGFLIVLMYVSMGHMMWGWWLPEFLAKNHIAVGLVQLLLTGIIMIINQRFFISGFKSLFHKAPNMDTLVTLGAAASFCYSLFAAIFAPDRMHLFFESAAMIVTLVTLGKWLEDNSKRKTGREVEKPRDQFRAAGQPVPEDILYSEGAFHIHPCGHGFACGICRSSHAGGNHNRVSGVPYALPCDDLQYLQVYR